MSRVIKNSVDTEVPIADHESSSDQKVLPAKEKKRESRSLTESNALTISKGSSHSIILTNTVKTNTKLSGKEVKAPLRISKNEADRSLEWTRARIEVVTDNIPHKENGELRRQIVIPQQINYTARNRVYTIKT